MRKLWILQKVFWEINVLLQLTRMNFANFYKNNLFFLIYLLMLKNPETLKLKWKSEQKNPDIFLSNSEVKNVWISRKIYKMFQEIKL